MEVADENGCALYEYDYYDRFGELKQYDNVQGGGDAPTDDILFVGKDRDPDTLHYYFGGRWYEPISGTFLTPAPYGPDTEHPYAYCEGDPANFVDPDGALSELISQEFNRRNRMQDPLGSVFGFLSDNKDDIVEVAQGVVDVSTLPPFIGAACEVIGAGLDYACGDKGEAADHIVGLLTPGISAGSMKASMRLAAGVGFAGSVSRQSRQSHNNLLSYAKSKYPTLAGKTHNHHIHPRYMGGPRNGPTISLNAAYHQMITNRFRELQPYGQGARRMSPAEALDIMRQVYEEYPLLTP